MNVEELLSKNDSLTEVILDTSTCRILNDKTIVIYIGEEPLCIPDFKEIQNFKLPKIVDYRAIVKQELQVQRIAQREQFKNMSRMHSRKWR